MCAQLEMDVAESRKNIGAEKNESSHPDYRRLDEHPGPSNCSVICFAVCQSGARGSRFPGGETTKSRRERDRIAEAHPQLLVRIYITKRYLQRARTGCRKISLELFWLLEKMDGADEPNRRAPIHQKASLPLRPNPCFWRRRTVERYFSLAPRDQPRKAQERSQLFLNHDSFVFRNPLPCTRRLFTLFR